MKSLVMAVLVAFLFTAPVIAMAQDVPAAGAEHGKAATSGTSDTVKLGIALAMGFGLAIAVFGGAIGQSRGIAASVEAMARQPEAGGRIMGAMIIGLALIETLVIYMLLICFMLLGKLD